MIRTFAVVVIALAANVLAEPRSLAAQQFAWVHLDAATGTDVAVAVDATGQPSRIWHDSAARHKAVHYALDGSPLWTVDITGIIEVRGALHDLADGLIVYGSFQDSIRVGSRRLVETVSGTRAFILRLAAGGVIDQLVAPGAAEPDGHTVNAMAVAPDGALWFAPGGWVNSSVKRLDDNGMVVETLTQQSVLTVTSLDFSPDGSLWVAGATDAGSQSFNGHTVVASHTYNTYVVKYSPAHVFEWVQFIEDISFWPTHRLVADAEGCAYFGGPLYHDHPFGSYIPHGPSWVYDFFLTRISTTGEFLWLQELPARVTLADAFIGEGTYLACNGSGVVLGGFSRNAVEWIEGEPTTAYGSADAMVLRFDAEGNFESAKTAGGTSGDTADAIGVGPGGLIYVAGVCRGDAHFDDWTFPGAGMRAFFAAISPTATSVPSGDMSAGRLELTHIEPNPCSSETQVHFAMTEAGPVLLVAYNVKGELVTVLKDGLLERGEHTIAWDARDRLGREVPAGVYFLHWTTRQGSRTARVAVVR